jgi:hypothetical protein
MRAHRKRCATEETGDEYWKNNSTRFHQADDSHDAGGGYFNNDSRGERVRVY